MGKALVYVGRRADAQKQFSIAAVLELSSSDKSALQRWMKALHA
jgi:hypothetical protein